MNDRLLYKDFIGSAHFNADDDVFFGKIEGIPDLITFEGNTATELRNAFQEAVDDYVKICANIGKTPFKPYKGNLPLRIPSELHKKAAQQALLRGISLNRLVQDAIEKEIIITHHSAK